MRRAALALLAGAAAAGACATPAGAALAPLAVAPAAAADVYDVTFDVRLDVHRESRYESANFGVLSSRADVGVVLRGRIPGVRLDGGRLAADPLGLLPAGPLATVVAATGAYEESADGRVTSTCPVTRAEASGAPRLLASPDPGALRFSPLAALRVTRSCAGHGGPDTTAYSGVDRDGPGWLAGPVVARVAPPAAGEARVVREVAATAPLARCDRQDEPDPTARCTATIAGTVTFARVREGVPPAPPVPRWPNAPRLRTGGSLDTYDDLFVYRLARVDLDARLRARAATTRRDQPPGWGELDMALRWHRAFPGPVTDSQGGWWGTGSLPGSRTLGGFWSARGQRLQWRGTAAYDRGVAERGRSAGREWTHASAACRDLRWRVVGRLSGAFLRAPGGRVEVQVRVPGIGRSPQDCDAVPVREEGLLDELVARATVPASTLRRGRFVIPLRGERRTTAGRGGRIERELRIAGSVTLERDDACRTPPEYPCAARFFASN